MPEEHCFVCASDEGILLDIFTDGKNYRENIEICLSLRIQKKSIPSTKMCHKCVYELDQCSEFVRKYKKTQRIEKGKFYTRRGFCSLCMALGKKGYIFDLWNETRLDNSIEKLHNLFDVDFVEENLDNLSICLDCRYNLDVLSDLTCLFKDTSRYFEDIMNGDIAELPKMNTCVVRRKTTLIGMSKLSQSKSSLDSDASTVIIESQTHLRTLRSKKLNLSERKCDECNIKIVNGMDMYRYHHTGNTVCKECWLTKDPCEKMKNKAHEWNNKKMETKLCSVFLKDILSDSCDTEKKGCKIEKDTDDETVYVISSDDTDDENETEMLSIRLSKRKKPSTEIKEAINLKEYPKRTRLTRSNSVQTINVINKKTKRQTRSESVETTDYDDKNLIKCTRSMKKSLASTSKPIVEKNLKESRSRANISKKRKIHKLKSSSSPNGHATSSKVRRSSSSSPFEINTSELKNNTDTDNSQSYTCKICSNDYDNKIVGLMHELTHSKKLEVVLEKVALSHPKELHEIIDREPSTEYDSPAHHSDEQTKSVNEFHLAVTDNSTHHEVCDISNDDSDSANENSEIKLSPNLKSDDDEPEEKREEEEANKGKAKTKTDEVINDEVAIEPCRESGQVVNNDKVNVDFEEQPKNSVESNIVDKEAKKRDDTELPKIIEVDENEVETQANKKNDKKPDENAIECEEKDSHEEQNIKNEEESSEKISEEMTENEVDSIPQCKSVKNDNEKVADENEKERNTDETEETKICNSKNEKANENNGEDEEQSNNEKSNEKIDENHSNEEVFNGDKDEKISEIEQTKNDENKDEVDLSKAAECNEVLIESEQHADSDENNYEKKFDDIAENNINNTILPTETETILKDTEIDDIVNNDRRRESTEIEKKLEEMMGSNDINGDE